MTQIIIILLITAFILTSSLLSAGKLVDKRYKGIKKIRTKGWIVFIIDFLIIALSVTQLYLNKTELNKSENRAVIRQEKRDSVLKHRYDSSLLSMLQKYDSNNLRTITTVTNLLGEYGYKYDSVNSILIKTMDESSFGAEPVVQLCAGNEIEISVKDSLILTKIIINLCSYDAGSKNIKLNFNILIEYEDGEIYKLNRLETMKGLIIAKDQGYITFSSISASNTSYRLNITNMKSINVLVSGSYTNMRGTIKYEIEELYFYDFKMKKCGLLDGESKKRLMKHLI